MKNSYEIVGQDGQVFWRIMPSGCSSVWDALTIQVSETVPAEIPDFQDQSEALLLNTIERWCIINGFTMRKELFLEKGAGIYDGYTINGERVFLSIRWLVDAKVYRRRSKRTRIEHFEVHSENREDAKMLAGRKFKGAVVKEFLSLTPSDWGHCFWRDRKGFPNLDPDILNRLKMPDDL